MSAVLPLTLRMSVRRQGWVVLDTLGKASPEASTQGLDAGKAESEKEPSRWREAAAEVRRSVAVQGSRRGRKC